MIEVCSGINHWRIFRAKCFLNLPLSCKLCFQLMSILNMKMLPETLCSNSIDWGKRFPGKPSISIKFLQKIFGARDGCFSNGEIGTSKYALDALSFGKEG